MRLLNQLTFIEKSVQIVPENDYYELINYYNQQSGNNVSLHESERQRIETAPVEELFQETPDVICYTVHCFSPFY